MSWEWKQKAAVGDQRWRSSHDAVVIVLIVIAALVLIGGLIAWLAVGGWRFYSEVVDDTSVAVAITEIRVSGRTGSVEVRPDAASRVDIHRTVRCFWPFRSRPREPRFDGTVLHLDAGEYRFCWVAYVVEAPEGVRVTGELTTGSFLLTGTSTVDGRVTTGGITLRGTTGDITARSSTGRIEGDRLRSATIDATASTGSVSLGLETPADVRAQTSTGSIRVAVPDDTYRIDAKTTVGSTEVDVPDDPAGAHHLDLHTNTGSIAVLHR